MPTSNVATFRRSGVDHQSRLWRPSRFRSTWTSAATTWTIRENIQSWTTVRRLCAVHRLLNALLLVLMVWLFHTRWRVAD